MNILYEDTALVVLDKPAGLTSEEGVPAALRQRWGRPDAYVGVIHRLDTGVSGLMVYARTPGAAAALTKQVTESQQAYAILDGRAEAGPGAPAQPCFLKTYRAVIAGGPDEQLPPEGILRDYLFKDSRKGRVFPVKRPRKGVREAVLEYCIVETAPDGSLSLAEITLHTGRTHQIRVQFATIVNDTMENFIAALETSENLKGVGVVLQGYNSAEKYELVKELIAPHLNGMFVTPKDIDETIRRISYTVSEALNLLFSGKAGESEKKKKQHRK